MIALGRRDLVSTTDPAEVAKRAACAEAGHRPLTYNPWHDATWCGCGAVVVEGDHAPIPVPRVIERRGKYGRHTH